MHGRARKGRKVRRDGLALERALVLRQSAVDMVLARANRERTRTELYTEALLGLSGATSDFVQVSAQSGV
jgi:hypothetical protein